MTAQNFLQVLAGKKVNANSHNIMHDEASSDSGFPAV